MKVQMCLIIDEGKYAGDYRKIVEMPFCPFTGLNVFLEAEGEILYCTVHQVIWHENEPDEDSLIEAYVHEVDGEMGEWKGAEIEWILEDPDWHEF